MECFLGWALGIQRWMRLWRNPIFSFSLLFLFDPSAWNLTPLSLLSTPLPLREHQSTHLSRCSACHFLVATLFLISFCLLKMFPPSKGIITEHGKLAALEVRISLNALQLQFRILYFYVGDYSSRFSFWSQEVESLLSLALSPCL